MSGQPTVLVTGCGLVGPFGVDVSSLRVALTDGRACWGPCTQFATPHQVGQVRDFRLADHVKNPRAERSPRISQLALAAAAQAIRQSGLDARRIGGERVAIVYGTGNGPAVSSERSLESIVTRGLAAVDPLVFQESVFNAPASLISIQFGIKGPVVVLPMGWTAGLCALKQGVDLLRCGRAERVLVVAADELAATTLDALDRLGLVSPNDGREEAMRPFDQRVNGAIHGEGAAALLLETASAAVARGATGLACVAGCAIGGDLGGPAAPDPGGAALVQVMRQTLERAGRTPDGIDHVLAGTLATSAADSAELNGLLTLFADRRRPCPLTSLTSTIGAIPGPGGLMAVVAALLEIQDSLIFGNHGLERADLPPLRFPGQTVATPVRSVLVNAIGLCGTYACALLEAVQ